MAEYSDEEWRSFVGDKKSTVTGYLNQAKLKEAFSEIVKDPPAGCKDQSIRDANADTVNAVLNAIKENDIPNYLKEITPDEIDVLMRYIYVLMARSDTNSQKLLAWHEQTLNFGGLGSIIRALTDRRVL
eukprot:TRINITY_DN1465_c0_g4_i1.p1 TRINITY_DN1465_c0_g4~~TRINITY_DN1465_c0_g4_i1.p1  ORF type:complete len:129 (-),score=40.20 TRINITY_DN1465_c0_g4_i1:100-486(-)